MILQVQHSRTSSLMPLRVVHGRIPFEQRNGPCAPAATGTARTERPAIAALEPEEPGTDPKAVRVVVGLAGILMLGCVPDEQPEWV